MRASLVAVAGPWQGQEFPLSGETTVGRIAGNTLVFEDNSVSRHHCVLMESDTGVHFRDLGSANPTRINGTAVGEKLLSPGDEIEIGRSLFRFVVEQDEPAGTVANGESIEHAVDPFETTVLRPGAEAASHGARTLAELLDLAAQLPRCATVPEFLAALLPRLQKLTGTDRAACFDAGDLGRCLGASVDGVAASRTLLRRSLELGAPVMGVARGAGADPAARSLVLSRIEAAMAAPLLAGPGGGIAGGAVLYVERSQGVPSEEDLRLLGAVAQLAAGSFGACARRAQLEAENRRLRSGSFAPHMVGRSSRMRDVQQFIARVSRADSTVLIEGESGTGKELIARAIHAGSARSGGPLVAVNCAALTETLLESELFGHEKGAFTGAIATRKGRFEEAAGGTFFLDEIGEMPASIQAKLLRVLQEREFQRVGGSRVIKADVRVIAATNRDLQEEVKNRAFRGDLLYRLRVLSIKVPSLRERSEDIAPLAQHFLEKHATRAGRPIERMTPEAIRLLEMHSWPGNVRELENAVERAVVMAEDVVLRPEDFADVVTGIAPRSDANGGAGSDWHGRLLEAKRQIVRQAFAEAAGEHNEAARILDMHPNNLRRLVKSLGL